MKDSYYEDYLEKDIVKAIGKVNANGIRSDWIR